jgi:hypothetical protein
LGGVRVRRNFGWRCELESESKGILVESESVKMYQL